MYRGGITFTPEEEKMARDLEQYLATNGLKWSQE